MSLGDLETGGVAFEIIMARSGAVAAPPEWVQLTPRGAVTARDGRKFIFDPERLAAAFRDAGLKLPVDFEHESEFTVTLGAKPARAWIVEVQPRDAGLFGRVEWLPEAITALANKAYRYISPTFFRDVDGSTARLLKSAALVTSPALEMPAIASASRKGQSMQLPVEITKALGLPGTASVDDAVTAIRGIPGKGVEMASTLAAMATVVNELNELRRSSGSKHVDGKVTTAIRAGKLPPALKDWGLELCASNEAAFDTFVEKTISIIRPGEYTYDMNIVSRANSMPDNSTEAMIAQQLGVDPAALKD